MTDDLTQHYVPCMLDMPRSPSCFPFSLDQLLTQIVELGRQRFGVQIAMGFSQCASGLVGVLGSCAAGNSLEPDEVGWKWDALNHGFMGYGDERNEKMLLVGSST